MSMIFLFALNAIIVSADTSEYYTYTITNEQVTITDCDNSITGDITIPTIIEGYPVTAIGSYAFYGCNNLEKIRIPNSITVIDASAFINCINLTNIVVSEDNQNYFSDENGVLFSKDKTKIINYPTGKKEQGYTIPDTVTVIGSRAFYGHSYLESIIISDNVNTIGQYAFAYSYSLRDVTLGNSVKTIEDYVFYYCTGLKNIYWNTSKGPTFPYNGCSVFKYAGTKSDGIKIVFGDNVEKIPDYLFYYTDSSSRPNIKSAVISNKVKTIGYQAFYNCTNLTDVTFGDNVVEVGSSAFVGCTKLTSAELPKTVNKIGNSAFSGCTTLTSISIPESLTSIGSQAFYGCEKLENIYWNTDKVTNISSSSGIFKYAGQKSNGIAVVFGDNVTKIPKHLFNNGSNTSYAAKITSVKLPEGITDIGEYAFYYCTSLKSITFPQSLVSIGYSSFYGCSGLTSLIIPDNVTTIGDSAFYRCDYIKEVSMGKGVKTIAYGAFCECTSLTSITIPENVTSIGNAAFYNCNNLTKIYWNAKKVDDFKSDTTVFCSAGKNKSGIEVIFGDTVERIPAYAFYIADTYPRNHKITSVSFSKSIKTVGAYAFYNCSELVKVSTTDLGAWCSIQFMNGSATPLVYAKNLYFNGEIVTSIDIPDGITQIGQFALSGCKDLMSVIIPESITNISYGAFDNCSNLNDVYYRGTENDWEGITISSYNTKLLNATMHYNYNELLEYITYVITDYNDVKITDCDTGISGDISIPSKIEGYPVTTIDYNAFRDCTNIESVFVPDSVTRIYGSAFENCTNLNSVSIPETLTWLGGSAFGNCTSLKSVTLPVNLSFIGDRAFYGCTNLTSIEIDENSSEFSSIEGNLFNKQVTTMLQYSIGKSESAYIIPDGVTMIDTYCFEDCVNLSSITIPESIQEIRMTAFRDCPNIKNVYYYGTQDEWNKVLIGTYNDGLTGATIHFIKPRTETVLSNNDKTFTITPINIATGNMVILALYNGTALVEMQSLVYNGEPIPFTTTKDYANAKVFVWENFETLVPICEAEIVK